MTKDYRAPVFAFLCWHKTQPESTGSTINALTAGKARYEYWLEISEPCPDLKLIDIRVRKVGAPHSSPQFIRNAAYRGMPDVRCGQRVRTNGSEGVIVGHNSSANFDVLFQSGEYAGAKLDERAFALDIFGQLLRNTAGKLSSKEVKS